MTHQEKNHEAGINITKALFESIEKELSADHFDHKDMQEVCAGVFGNLIVGQVEMVGGMNNSQELLNCKVEWTKYLLGFCRDVEEYQK